LDLLYISRNPKKLQLKALIERYKLAKVIDKRAVDIMALCLCLEYFSRQNNKNIEILLTFFKMLGYLLWKINKWVAIALNS